MAPHKLPVSLYNLSHKSYVSLLFNTCMGIEQRHGTYDSEECVQAVHDLQNVLVSTVPGKMWNHICESLLMLVSKHQTLPFDWRASDLGKVLQISYSLFAHANLSKVVLFSGVDHYRGLCYNYLQWVERINFWEKIFIRTNKVTSVVFPDELVSRYGGWGLRLLFEVIDNHCPDLQTIHIGLTAVSIQEAVTFLLNCTKLRRIEGRCQLCCQFSRQEYKHLLDSLPDLECFNDPLVVTCFPDLEDGRSLKFTDLIIRREESTSVYVTLAARVCPKLKHLTVDPGSVQDCFTILGILADSRPTNLTSLTVQSDTSLNDNNCQRFLATKGVHLLNLKLKFCSAVGAFNSVKLIGEFCLNLECLYFELSDGSDEGDRPTAGDLLIDHRSSVFKKLTKLTVKDLAQNWDHSYYKWCVLHATNLQTLELFNFQQSPLRLEDVLDMFSGERLSGLVNLTFLLGILNREMIQCVYDNCPKMRRLEIWDEVDIVAKQYVKTLKKCIAIHNKDLIISYIPVLVSFDDDLYR